MANMLMMRYAAQRMAKEDGKYQERGIGNDEDGYPLPYREPRPEFGETEARYRGEDGRYKSGTRRNQMNEKKWEFSVKPQDTYQQTTERPYIESPGMDYGREPEDAYDDPPGRVIGFGSIRNHYAGKHAAEEGHSQKGQHHMKMHHQKLDRETAMEWVRNMKNEDPQKPTGGKWDIDVVRAVARSLGVPDEGEEFWELYVMTNALYSDYSKVLGRFGITDPMAYGEMAKAWMHDKDAIDDKTMVYYECIVKPKMEEGA